MIKDVIDIFVLIVYLAMLAVVVTNKNSVNLLNSVGQLFTGSIKVAKEG